MELLPIHLKKMQKFCSTNMANFWSKNFWPSSSPDLTPMDYVCWGAVESKTKHISPGNLDSLKAAIAKNKMIFLKGILRGLVPLLEALSSHASQNFPPHPVYMSPTLCTGWSKSRWTVNDNI